MNADNLGALRITGLTRRYGKVCALAGLDLEVPAGAFVTLLGPSGCGKSTTLNLIAGLDAPNEGSILLGDRDITHVPPNQRNMAMVFQNYALYPHMTVFQNIAFGLKLQRCPRSEINERVIAVAAILDIEHLLNRRPSELSGGQQQRVSLGRALVKQPVVFLLDEPFSNLDATLRSRMRTEIKRLHLMLGTTSVFVTHDQEEALALSDLIAVMKDGRLVQFGSGDTVYTRPENTYVATFLGKPRMSLIEGALESNNGSVSFVAQDVRLDLGQPAALDLPDGHRERVLLGVRAEDVRVGDLSDLATCGFDARAGLSEPVGSDTFVELVVGGATVVARVPPTLGIQSGDAVRAELAASRLHLFDAGSGERLRAA